MAEFRLTPAAERDLEAIWRFTAQRWGVEQADRYTDMIADMFAELAKTPERAPACDDIRIGFRRRRVEHHLIYFQTTPYGIAVVRILHARMDAGSYF